MRIRRRRASAGDGGKSISAGMSSAGWKRSGWRRTSGADGCSSIVVAGFLIESGKDAGEKLAVICIAVSGRLRTDQRFGAVRTRLRRTIVDGREIGNVLIVPGRRVALRYTAAAFRKARVADIAVVAKELTGCRAHSFGSRRGEGFRDALIALAVIVGADIKVRMGFAA